VIAVMEVKSDSSHFTPQINKIEMLLKLTTICCPVHLLIASRYGVCLIGVRRANSSKVLLNPGSSYMMGYNDTCFYISMSSEEESAFKEVKESKSSKFGSSSGDFSDPSNKIMIEMSDTKNNGASKYW
jgi:hypothetical protein